MESIMVKTFSLSIIHISYGGKTVNYFNQQLAHFTLELEGVIVIECSVW